MVARAKTAGGKRRRLRVELADRSYPIEIGHDCLSDAGDAIARCTGARRVVILTEARVGRRYAGRLTRSLRAAGLGVEKIEVPSGDATKNLRTVERLYARFVDFGLDRRAAIVALGGGMVGDLAGFAAATYLRGIPFVQVPTTVLAMVDASIGGKTGVNLARGKNLVGAFHQPRLVWIDTAILESLPRRERAAGIAEVIKAGAIWDARLFKRLERDLEAVLDLDPTALVPVLYRACGIKAEVVSQDERETGLRTLLNFGHTLGHAVETLQGYKEWLHGEAVAAGMVYAANRSEDLGFSPAGTRQRLEDLVQRAGLPGELPTFSRNAYLSCLGVDKKKVDSRIHFVALRGIGTAQTVKLTPREIYPAVRKRASRKTRARPA